ncbi:IS66 family insertion sequence element accessory protein TnpB [Vibrio splendidus]
MPLTGGGALFLFTDKQRDKIKVLYWDKTGVAFWYKHLEKAEIQVAFKKEK